MRRLSTVLILAICATVLWSMRPRGVRSAAEEISPTVTEHQEGVLVLDLMDDLSSNEVAALGSALGMDLELSTPFSADEGLYRTKVPDLAVAEKAAEASPLVESAEPVRQFQILGYPDDPMYDKQWNMEMINAPTGWRAGGGRGVKGMGFN